MCVAVKAKLEEISSDTHPLQLIKLHHFKLERFSGIVVTFQESFFACKRKLSTITMTESDNNIHAVRKI